MKYLAIGFWSHNGNQTFSLSRKTDSTDINEIIDLLQSEGRDTYIDTILLVCSDGANAPIVLKHWSSGNGDFFF